MKRRPARAAGKPRRRYLGRDDRRSHLLHTAAALVQDSGWDALTMIALADAAGVSRQLVYQHFGSIDALLAATMAHLLSDAYDYVREAVHGSDRELVDLVRIAGTLTFNLQPARARALWQITAPHGRRDAATTRMSRRLRHLLVNLWLPAVQRRFGFDEAQSRGLIWMLNMGLWGAMQLVDDRELDRDGALALSTWMVERLAARPRR